MKKKCKNETLTPSHCPILPPKKHSTSFVFDKNTGSELMNAFFEKIIDISLL
jgi:hypothetical protein